MNNTVFYRLFAAAALLGRAAAAQTPAPSTIQWRPLNEPGSGGAVTALSISPTDRQRQLIGGDMLGVGLSEDGGQTWLPTTGFRSWEIADFTWHPTRPLEVWAGTMSGPYVSRDGGRTWAESRAGFPPVGNYYTRPIQKILFDPANANHLLAFEGSHRGWGGGPGPTHWGAVWESTNGGAAWNSLAQATAGNAAPGVVAAAYVAGAASTTLLVAANGDGVRKSTDGGRTWNPANNGLPGGAAVRWVTAHPTDPNTAYAATDSYVVNGTRWPGAIYRTRNGAQSWQAVTQGLNQNQTNNGALCTHYETVVLAPSSPNVLYTSDMSYWPYGIFRSADGGDTWSVVLDYGKKQQTPTAFVPAPTMGVLAVDPRDPQHVLAGNTEYVLQTANGGQTWQDATSAPVPGRPGAFTGRGFAGLVTTAVRFNPFRPGHAVILGLDDGKFWQSRDTLRTWTWGGQGLDHWNGGHDVTFAGPQGNTMYVTFGQFGNFGGIGKTTDGGLHWTVTPESAFPPLSGSKEAAGVYALPTNPDNVWACLGGTLYRSVNGGTSWTVALAQPGLTYIEPLRNTPGTFYVSGANGVYVTTNGSNFQLVPGSPAGATRLRVDPTNDGRLYATAWRANPGGLWKFENNTWTRLNQDAAIADVDVDPTNNRRLVVTTNDDPYHDAAYVSGVALSEDGGQTWAPQNAGLAMLRGGTLRFDPAQPGRLVLGTNGRGFFRGQLRAGGTLAGLSERAAAAGPLAELLVAPNPAQAQLTGYCYAARAGRGLLTLTDAVGRTVRRSPWAAEAPGPQALPPLDVRGLPAGLYLLRVQLGPQVLTRRVQVQP